MKYLTVIEYSDSPIDYIAVSDTMFELLPEILKEESLKAKLIEIKDEEIIAELDQALNLYLEVEGSTLNVDRHGNCYEISKSPYKWGRWRIRVM